MATMEHLNIVVHRHIVLSETPQMVTAIQCFVSSST